MKSIKFGNKNVLQLVAIDKINAIKESIKSSIGMEISSKYYSFLNEKNVHILKDGNYSVCVNTFGHKYLLYLTQSNNQRSNIFINRKREDMIFVRFNFDEDLYENTLMDGELIKNNKNEWIYVITDILLYKNENVLNNKKLTERQNILHNIIENKFAPDVATDVCKMEIKKYFGLEYLVDIKERYIKELGYKCSGIFIQDEDDYRKSFMYIYTEFRTNDTKVENKVNIKTNVKKYEPNKDRVFNFLVSKVPDLPDIYELYFYDGSEIVKYGYAGVPDKETSFLLSNIFENREEEKIKMECEYSKRFDKWIPKKIKD